MKNNKIPGPLWIAIVSLSIMVLCKIAFAFTSSPLLLIDAVFSALLLYGLLMKRQWAYGFTIAFTILGTAWAMQHGLSYGMTVLVMDCLVLIPVLMCTHFFYPKKANDLI